MGGSFPLTGTLFRSSFGASKGAWSTALQGGGLGLDDVHSQLLDLS